MNSSFKKTMNLGRTVIWMLATQSIYDDGSHKMALLDHTVHWLPGYSLFSAAAGSQVLTVDLPWASVLFSSQSYLSIMVPAEVTACSPPLKSAQSGCCSILNL